MPVEKDWTLARKTLDCGTYSCVAAKNGTVVYTGTGRGIRPVLQLFDQNQAHILKNTAVADKVIGKAAAMLLVFCGVKYIYGAVMSQSARLLLLEEGIPHSFGTLAEYIQNRAGNGLCPIEQAVEDISSPALALEAVRAAVAKLMAHTPSL